MAWPLRVQRWGAVGAFALLLVFIWTVVIVPDLLGPLWAFLLQAHPT
ncbi:MAG TPA: hypothetical protein VJ935_07160 [Acidimicrobiia bacterium]|nr:hypothetical protein [Acidimicrobiia bacterium]